MNNAFAPGNGASRLVSRDAALANLAAPAAAPEARDSHLHSFLQDLGGAEVAARRRCTALLLAPAGFAIALAVGASLVLWLR